MPRKATTPPLTLKALDDRLGTVEQANATARRASEQALEAYEQRYQRIYGTLWGRLRWLLTGK